MTNKYLDSIAGKKKEYEVDAEWNGYQDTISVSARSQEEARVIVAKTGAHIFGIKKSNR